MKAFFPSSLICLGLATASLFAQTGGGTVNFCNDNSARIFDSGTGNPVASSAGVRAALYWAPAGSNDFVQLGDSVAVGVPLPGLFAGGTRITGPGSQGGAPGRFQVRAWTGEYGSYEQALFRGGVLGQSAIVDLVTGDPAAAPPSPAASLTANGLTGFSLPLPTPVAPSILTQPIHQSVSPGATASFSVTVAGTSPFSFQWQYYGTNLEGQTSSTLTLTNVMPEMVGRYSVNVSNAVGTISSAAATLTVFSVDASRVLTLFGNIGDRYRVEYVDAIESTNWSTLSELSLPDTPYSLADTNMPGSSQRFYRAVYLP